MTKLTIIINTSKKLWIFFSIFVGATVAANGRSYLYLIEGTYKNYKNYKTYKTYKTYKIT